MFAHYAQCGGPVVQRRTEYDKIVPLRREGCREASHLQGFGDVSLAAEIPRRQGIRVQRNQSRNKAAVQKRITAGVVQGGIALSPGVLRHVRVFDHQELHGSAVAVFAGQMQDIATVKILPARHIRGPKQLDHWCLRSVAHSPVQQAPAILGVQEDSRMVPSDRRQSTVRRTPAGDASAAPGGTACRRRITRCGCSTTEQIAGASVPGLASEGRP